MRKNLLLFFTAAIGFTFAAQAQKITKKADEVQGLQPTYIEFDNATAPSFVRGNVLVQDAKQKLQQQSGLLLRSSADGAGFVHYRIQQLYNGIPVEDAVYIVHVKSGKIVSENGRWVKDFPKNLAAAAALTEKAALQNALQKVNAKSYKWQNAAEENYLKIEKNDRNATYYPKGQLVYFSGGDEVTPQNLRLAYKFDVYATAPLSRQYVFVDAVTGKVLDKKDLIQTADGTAITAYSGTRAIKTTKSGGSYILNDITRGKGVTTLNLHKTTNYDSAVEFKDADNVWNNVNADKDEYATDAHFGAESTYDFYKYFFNRNSIDDSGFAIKSYVHYSTNYFNAFWDGQEMTYGDGDASDSMKPLTALDVCGHEITHGLTSFTANLNYKNESGAMNEGFSDIFGTAIEFYARPEKADWLIGGDFGAIRDMSNPNAYSQPDTYKGKYWAKGLLAYLDNGGVHTNSGIMNYWFYLLTSGGSGTNDNGLAFNVTGIGIEKAQAIAYRTLTTYLVPTSVYKDARTYSIKAAKDLYGKNSAAAKQVVNAWDAVGVKAAAATMAIESDENLIVSAELKTADITVNRQYPNPVKNQFTIEFSYAKAGSLPLSVYSLNGNKVYQQMVAVNKGYNIVKVSLPNISAGTYLVKFNNEKATTIQVAQ